MDNPDQPLNIINKEGEIEEVISQKTYYLNIVMQVKYEDQTEYKRFRIVLSRNGILEVQEL